MSNPPSCASLHSPGGAISSNIHPAPAPYSLLHTLEQPVQLSALTSSLRQSVSCQSMTGRFPESYSPSYLPESWLFPWNFHLVFHIFSHPVWFVVHPPLFCKGRLRVWVYPIIGLCCMGALSQSHLKAMTPLAHSQFQWWVPHNDKIRNNRIC